MKKFVSAVGKFFYYFILTFLLMLAFVYIFYKFELISIYSVLFIPFVVALIVTSVCFLVVKFALDSKKKVELAYWLARNSSKLYLFYVFAFIFFVCIEPELFFDIEEMKNLISLEWTILGISITVFLIWHVVVLEYLENKKPKKPVNSLPTKFMLYLAEKGEYYFDATMLLSNANLLKSNLICVSVATIFIYVTFREANFLTQSMIILGLILCTNTIIGLIFDILKLFGEKKSDMLAEMRITNFDVKLQDSIEEESKKIILLCETIDELENIDNEEKIRLKSEIFEKYIDKFKDKLDIKAGDTYDQL